nr:NUDIX domain-containing protein [Pseudomonadota bacterium]
MGPGLVKPVHRAIQRLRRFLWRFTGRPIGVHAIPITPAGKIVMVKLSYAPLWRLPGGGCKRGEDPKQAVLRELREEI